MTTMTLSFYVRKTNRHRSQGTRLLRQGTDEVPFVVPTVGEFTLKYCEAVLQFAG